MKRSQAQATASLTAVVAGRIPPPGPARRQRSSRANGVAARIVAADAVIAGQAACRCEHLLAQALGMAMDAVGDQGPDKGRAGMAEVLVDAANCGERVGIDRSVDRA